MKDVKYLREAIFTEGSIGEEMTIKQDHQDEYIPFNEALNLFKPLDKNKFFYRVKKKEINTIEGATERDTRYSTKDVIQVREKLLRKAPQKKEQIDVVFDWLYPQDITAAMDLDYIVYHEHFIGEAQLYQSWRHKNHHISMAAYDAHDRRTCLGYIGLIPLPEPLILEILREKRDELTIKPEEIEDYTREGGYTLLANSAAIHPDRPDLLFKIMYKVMEYWIEQYPQRFIRKLYAQAVSEKGEMFVQHFFMAPRPDLAYNAYELDLAKPSASKIIRRFKEQLAAKAPLPDELQYPPKLHSN